MIPKRVSLKNFLSFGEPAVELVFAEDEPLWVLSGPNGAGKSAVFDAITYALYGEHRGGQNNADQLVRHGANEFEIEFDFEFGGRDYRIRRTRPRKKGARTGRTTQHLLRRDGADWKCIRGNDPAGAVRAEDIAKWVIETLGLGYDAFTNSVLLLQGKADKLFSADREERLDVLKGIIGFEQFADLSERVRNAASELTSEVKRLWARLEPLAPVTDGQLATARKAVADAEAGRAAAEGVLETAVERRAQAKRWTALEGERADLERHLLEAEARDAERQRIREEKATLDELDGVVPVLAALLEVRGRLARLRAQLEEAQGNLRDRELARDIKKAERLLIDVVEVEGLDEELRKYPSDLDAQLRATTEEETRADEVAKEAARAQARAEALCDQARQRQEDFAQVTAGMPCSRCGQPVSEEHAARERADLAEEVRCRQAELEKATAASAKAAGHLASVQGCRKGMEKRQRERDQLRVRRESRWHTLSAHPEFTSAADLRTRLSTLRSQQGGGRLDERPAPADARRLEQEASAARVDVERLQRDLDRAHGEERTTLGRLPELWVRRLPELDGAQVAGLADRRAELKAAGVTARFQELERDEVRRAEWERQLAALRTRLDEIPPGGRIAVAEAERLETEARRANREAEQRRNAAVEERKDLDRRKQERDTLSAQHREAAERQRLHKRLDDLLGRTGLQFALVQDAEEQIISFANETLQQLSDGELVLEEDDTAGSSKAFDLRVRRVGGEPVGVAFLSGSQRFRVAVSVALAVGRFASGRARPLEGVIIDEGFGSLDRDGLRATADELNRLRRHLKRIVLVSHQEEFAERFPVAIRLSPGESGTTAEVVRR